MIDFTYSHLLVGLALLTLLLIFFVKQKRSFWYLLFFSAFWIYLLFVVSVIAFPIVPLPKENWQLFKPNINLVPFYFGTCDMPELCYREIMGNIQLAIPFGFGINFLIRLKPKNFLWLAIVFGLVLETIQLFLSVAFRSAFRAVDINDVILNAIGVWLGYFFFRLFGYLYVYTTKRLGIQDRPVLAYLNGVVRQSTGD